jgi:hypothetical protein
VCVLANSPLVGDPLRETEVGEVGVVRAVGPRADIEQHVGRLDVAMHETAGMCDIQGARHLRQDPRGLRRIQAPTPEALLQVAALHVAHRDEEVLLGRTRLVDRDDVRVVDGRGELGLAQEAVAERLVLRKRRSEQLECDLPLQSQVLGEIDDAHAAQPEQGFDPVAGELGAEPGVVGHLHVRPRFLRPEAKIGRLVPRCKGAALQPHFRHATRPERSILEDAA